MKTKHHLDIEEMERLKISRDNLELMHRHIKRLEAYALKVDDILNLESMSDSLKLKKISIITDIIKQDI